jgi:hypothetical protein
MGAHQLRISTVDMVGSDRIIVDFSDDTQAIFTLAQLTHLAPERSPSNTEEDDLGSQRIYCPKQLIWWK